MTIFAVELKTTVVVEADDEVTAREIAQNSTMEILATQDLLVDDAWPVRDVRDLPDGWDGECFPYGRDNRLDKRLELFFPPYTD